MSFVCVGDILIKSKAAAGGGWGQLLRTHGNSTKETPAGGQGALCCSIFCIPVIFVKCLNNNLCCCVNKSRRSTISQIIQK